jgi:hypothetical protein
MKVLLVGLKLYSNVCIPEKKNYTADGARIIFFFENIYTGHARRTFFIENNGVLYTRT